MKYHNLTKELMDEKIGIKITQVLQKVLISKDGHLN